MLKPLIVTFLGCVLLASSTCEAQRFRRFFSPPPSQAQPAPRYNPAPRYTPAPPSNAYNRQPVTGNIYRGQQVVPTQARPNTQPSTAAPQRDIARQQGQAGQQPGGVRLEGPQPSTAKTTQATGQRQPGSSSATTQPQQYRRVTVYNPRTGQRSVQLVPIPTTSLAQQPYVYGRSGGPTPAQPAPTAASRIATPGVSNNQPTVAKTPAASSTPVEADEIRLDSQLVPATFNAPLAARAAATPTPTTTAQAKAAAVAPNQPRRDDGQFSVLEHSDSDAGKSNSSVLELSAPAS